LTAGMSRASLRNCWILQDQADRPDETRKEKKIMATEPIILDDLWWFLCDCENAGDRTRKTALTVANQNHGEGEYRLARDVKYYMVILGYKPSSNAGSH